MISIDLVGVNVLYLLEALENNKTSGAFNFVSLVFYKKEKRQIL